MALHNNYRAQRSRPRWFSSPNERVPRCALHNNYRAQRSGPRWFSSPNGRVPRCALHNNYRAQRSGPRWVSSPNERVPRCALHNNYRAQRSGPRWFSSPNGRVPRCALHNNYRAQRSGPRWFSSSWRAHPALCRSLSCLLWETNVQYTLRKKPGAGSDMICGAIHKEGNASYHWRHQGGWCPKEPASVKESARGVSGTS